MLFIIVVEESGEVLSEEKKELQRQLSRSLSTPLKRQKSRGLSVSSHTGSVKEKSIKDKEEEEELPPVRFFTTITS